MEKSTPPKPNLDPALSGRNDEVDFQDVAKRLDRIEALLTQQHDIISQTPSLVATLVNTLDANIDRLQDRGVDVEARVQNILRLAELVSDPAILSALEALLEHPKEAKRILGLVHQASGVFAMFTNIFDAWMNHAIAQGIDPAEAAQGLLDLAIRAASLAQRDELRASLNETLLNPETFQIMRDLTRIVQDTYTDSKGYMGLFGAFKASRDKRVQRTLHFSIQLASRLGEFLEQSRRKLPPTS